MKTTLTLHLTYVKAHQFGSVPRGIRYKSGAGRNIIGGREPTRVCECGQIPVFGLTALASLPHTRSSDESDTPSVPHLSLTHTAVMRTVPHLFASVLLALNRSASDAVQRKARVPPGLPQAVAGES
eukprot:632881-Pyramimonas_sp.AAC.1